VYFFCAKMGKEKLSKQTHSKMRLMN